MESGLHKRLKLARIAAGYRSARHAAEALDLPYATYQAHESGKRNPSIAQVKAYAQAFRVSDVYLLAGGQAPTSNISAPLPAVRMVSIVSWAAASNFAEAEAEYGEKIPVPSSSSTLVALRVVGNSMDREAPHGSVIVVDYTQTFPVDKALVMARRGSETTFKRYRDTEGPRRFEPASTDPSHQTIFDNGEAIEIIGRVIYIIRAV
jgi:SOS-response transcriptional repressor LexA